MTGEQQGIKFIGEMEKVSFKPGDVCVITVDRPIPMEAAERIRSQWEQAVGRNDLTLIVLSEGMKLGVLSPASDEAS